MNSSGWLSALTASSRALRELPPSLLPCYSTVCSRTVLVYSIPYGGPVSMVWGVSSLSFLSPPPRFDDQKQFLTGCVFVMCIALSIAEMGSSAPTAGALYYWTFRYSPPSCRRYLAWLIGCGFPYLSLGPTDVSFLDVNSIGYIAAVAAMDYTCALTILTTVTLSTDGAYIATSGHI